MCGFGVSSRPYLANSNRFCQKRGPDLTSIRMVDGIQFLHNLLHITGELTPQPFINDDIACIFNGEIYNFKQFGNYKSDGLCLIDVYRRYGKTFASHLDGEFAICIIDFKSGDIILATDTFACKPLWYCFEEEHFGISSYLSQLSGLGFTRSKKLLANTTLIFDLKTLQLKQELKNFAFDLNQFKTSCDDWVQAFSRSINKRTQNTSQSMFLGLSSGYDSGAIACELFKQSVPFKAYSIATGENESILNARAKILNNVEKFQIGKEEYQQHLAEIQIHCESFQYGDRFKNYDIKTDPASVGLAAICARANLEKRRIYFSGQGADEIISDYGFAGRKIYNHSSFGGLFPDDLEGFFPWHSFWDGTQIQYLNKEEYVAGHYGIETRYPFLDRDLVQEFLWLHPSIKNSAYKSVLQEYLTRNDFPFSPGEKRGFTPKV
jgi:asparagine synthetase B (glutamine-hydrolysing)